MRRTPSTARGRGWLAAVVLAAGAACGQRVEIVERPIAVEGGALAPEDDAATLVALLAAPEDAARLEALNGLIALGAEAVPALADALRAEEPWVRARAAVALGRIGRPAQAAVRDLVRALRDPVDTVRKQAAIALGAVGVDTDGAAAALAAALTDPSLDVTEAATDALARLGSPAVAELGVIARGGAAPDDLVARYAAVTALGSMGAGGDAAVPALVEALGDDSPRLRARAAWALGEVGAASTTLRPRVVPALVRALGDADIGVQLAAADALGRIGPRAAPAARALGRLRRELTPAPADPATGPAPPPDPKRQALLAAVRQALARVRSGDPEAGAADPSPADPAAGDPPLGSLGDEPAPPGGRPALQAEPVAETLPP